jgi:hypothetical protein
MRAACLIPKELTQAPTEVAPSLWREVEVHSLDLGIYEPLPGSKVVEDWAVRVPARARLHRPARLAGDLDSSSDSMDSVVSMVSMNSMDSRAPVPRAVASTFRATLPASRLPPATLFPGAAARHRGLWLTHPWARTAAKAQVNGKSAIS